MGKQRIIIGTRGSKLALWQANHIAGAIKGEHPDALVITKVIQTTGDRMQQIPLSQIGGKGLFTKEIEEAMMAGEVDLAVHSLKDVPTELPQGLEIAVMTKRAHPGDAFVSSKYDNVDDLPQGAQVGTSSLRRGAQLLHYRPDLTILPLRGNVDTRLKKLDSGEFDAIILAVSGLKRLGWEARITQVLPLNICLPAVGQGALGLEIRSDDIQTRSLIAFLEDSATRYSVEAERSFLSHLEGNCQVPFGVFGQFVAGEVELEAAILSLDGKICYRDKMTASIKEVNQLGIQLAEKLSKDGGSKILASLKGNS